MIQTVSPSPGLTFGPASGVWWAWPNGRSTGAAVTALRCYFHWTLIPAPTKFSQIGIDVTSGAALSSVQLGLYTARNGLPDLALFRSASTASTATAALPINLTGPSGSGLYLDAGYYFLAVCSDGTPSIRNALQQVPGAIGYASLSATAANTHMHTTLGSLSLPEQANGLTYTQATGNFPGVMLLVA